MEKGAIIKLLAGLVAVLAVAVLLFYWDLARKEVKFLCGNFAEGVSRGSVLRQLDTGNQLRYREQPDGPLTVITVDSAWNFGCYRCVIPINAAGRVDSDARYEPR
ncbi:MAG: hypothetical protein V2J89_01865 [Halieaceae bacterium]|jgi:hypothetical protein|nr:hypothetical protein [Halieaceae bacterium]